MICQGFTLIGQLTLLLTKYTGTTEESGYLLKTFTLFIQSLCKVEQPLDLLEIYQTL